MTVPEVAMSQAQQKPSVSYGARIRKTLSALVEKAEMFFSGESTYQKGPDYPKVRVRSNGTVSVPLEELYRSKKARENLEALQGMIEADPFGREE